MEDRKPSHKELITMLKQPGWHLETDIQASSMKNRTLEDVLRAAHMRHAKGEEIGIIKRIENALELDLIDLQDLWTHLGLPI